MTKKSKSKTDKLNWELGMKHEEPYKRFKKKKKKSGIPNHKKHGVHKWMT